MCVCEVPVRLTLSCVPPPTHTHPTLGSPTIPHFKEVPIRPSNGGGPSACSLLFFLLIEAAAHTRLAEKREQNTVAVVVAAAHNRLAEEQEQHTVAAAVAVARQRLPQVSSSECKHSNKRATWKARECVT